MNDIEIHEYLESKGLWVKSAGANNIHTLCPFHNEEQGKAGRLYINVGDDDDKFGLYVCFRCGAKGNFNGIRRHFGDAPVDLGGAPPDARYSPIYELATTFYTEQLMNNPEAYRYLTEERGLSDQTIVSARLGWAGAEQSIMTHLIQNCSPEDIKASKLVDRFGNNWFNDEIIFPYLDYGHPTQLRGKKIGGKTRSMMDISTELYGIDSVIGQDMVVVGEGEPDQLLLQQMGFAAVGVPGVQSWKPEWTDTLESAKRIYIMFDNDKAGKAGAEKLAAKLGPRSRIVEIPKKGADVTDWVVKYGKTRDDFDYLISKAKGGLLVSVKEAFEEWSEIEGNPNRKGLRFNIDEIDRTMPLGLLPGQVVTVIAKTNSGKSIMSLNYFQRMRMLQPDLKILYMSLEQTRNEVFERIHRIHQMYNPGASTVDTINFWEDNLYIVDKNRISEAELEDSIYQCAYEWGDMPDLTCVDYIGYYARGAAGGSEYERTTNAVMGLKGIAKDTGTIILAPSQSNRSGDFGQELQADQAKSSGAVEETSDVMISLYAKAQDPKATQEQRGEVYQRILKSRNGGVGTQVKYQFAPLTLAMVPQSDRIHYDLALDERRCQGAGDTWQQYIQRRLTNNYHI